MRFALSASTWFMTAGLVALSLWSLMGSVTWTGEVVADYRWHLGWVCFLAAGVASAVRVWGASILLALVCFLHLRPELLLSLPSSEVHAGGAAFEVATASAGWGDAGRVGLTDWLEAETPDVAYLCRLDADMLAALDAREDGALHAVWPDRGTWNADVFGSGLWVASGLDVLEARVDERISDARVVLGGRETRVLGFRASRPSDEEAVERRARLVARVAEEAAAQPGVVVLTELNATGYSPTLRSLLGAADLTDTRAGFGRQVSWTSDVTPLGFQIAVDHVLIGGALSCLAREHDHRIESDHQPVLAKLAWRTAGPSD